MNLTRFCDFRPSFGAVVSALALTLIPLATMPTSTVAISTVATSTTRATAAITTINPLDFFTSARTKDTRQAANDPGLLDSWGLAHSGVQEAWKLSQGSKEIIVAVIDTGIDLKHEDLGENLWRNPNPNNPHFPGAVHGWNFVDNNPDLTDTHGHGSHIAGIIGATKNNSKGIAGLAPKVSLMILKYYDPKAPGINNLKNTIKAIRFAIDHGAHIINYSGGGLDYSAEEKTLIEEAERKGILFVAAAGNERSNSDLQKYYPADYRLSNIISVTAVDPKNQILASSNWGIGGVDIAAPGENILSTLPGNRYGYMTGTSQATAFVTGAAVLIKAKYPHFTPQQIKHYLTASGDPLPQLLGKNKNYRVLNVAKALRMTDSDLDPSGAPRKLTRLFKLDTPPFTSLRDSGRQVLSLLTQSGLIKTLDRVSSLRE
jgi:subtilisin family serine protease